MMTTRMTGEGMRMAREGIRTAMKGRRNQMWRLVRAPMTLWVEGKAAEDRVKQG